VSIASCIHLDADLAVLDFEQLEIADQPAGANAKQQAAAAHVVEQRGVAGDVRGMVLRQVDDAGAESYPFGLRNGCGEEGERR
jgi:hypothetical protein